MSKPTGKRSSLKRTVKLVIRLAVSAALIGFISLKLDFHRLFGAMRALSLETFLLICFLYLAGQILSAFKWRILVRSVGIIRPRAQFIRAYVFGMFVNTFAFGTVGGDVARAVALKPERGQRTAAFATVVADRIHGLGVLLAIGSFSILLYRPEQFPQWAIWLSAVAATGIALFWWLGPKILLALIRDGHKFQQTALLTARAFPHDPETFLRATLLSAVFHSLQIFMVFVISEELGANLPLAYLFCVIPIVNTAATLPLSIQGIGVRESLFAIFFTPFGVSSETSVALGAIWILTVTVVSALGGLLLAPDLVRASDKILEEESSAEVIDFDAARKKKQA